MNIKDLYKENIYNSPYFYKFNIHGQEFFSIT